jgi:peptidoglycan/LPS O-acetylase OafA/YrhL
MLFFMAGILLDKLFIGPKQITIPISLSIGLIFILVVSGFIKFNEVMIPPIRLSNITYPITFLYFSTIGIIAVVGIAQQLAKLNKLCFLKILGKYSLQIYLVHMLVGVGVRIILIDFFSIHNAPLHVIVGVSTGLVSPLILYHVCLKIKFPYLFEYRPFRRYRVGTV